MSDTFRSSPEPPISVPKTACLRIGVVVVGVEDTSIENRRPEQKQVGTQRISSTKMTPLLDAISLALSASSLFAPLSLDHLHDVAIVLFCVEAEQADHCCASLGYFTPCVQRWHSMRDGPCVPLYSFLWANIIINYVAVPSRKQAEVVPRAVLLCLFCVLSKTLPDCSIGRTYRRTYSQENTTPSFPFLRPQGAPEHCEFCRF